MDEYLVEPLARSTVSPAAVPAGPVRVDSASRLTSAPAWNTVDCSEKRQVWLTVERASLGTWESKDPSCSITAVCGRSCRDSVSLTPDSS